MEIACMNDSLRRWVPPSVQGLPILLVDHDFGSLIKVATMLGLLSFKVTTADRGYEALSMIGDTKQETLFKLVMANVDMEDTNILDFIQIVVQKDLPLILMTSRTNVEIARKGVLELGATCYFEKPISMNDLKYVWQNAYSKRKNNPTSSPVQVEGVLNLVKDSAITKHCSKLAKLGKRKERSSPGAVKEDTRTPIWDQELERKFKGALKKLGEDARVKSIQKAMNVPHLTRSKIATHLERHRYRKSKTVTTLPSGTPSASNSIRLRQEEPEERQEDLAIEGPDIVAAYKSAFPSEEAEPSFQEKCNFVASFIAHSQIQGSSIPSSDTPFVVKKFRTTSVKGNEELNRIQVSVAPSAPESGTPRIADRFLKDFTTGNGELSAMELSAPPASPKIQNNSLNDYDFLWKKLLEDEPDERTYLTNVLDPKEVNQYCELLRKELVSDPDSAPMEEVQSYCSRINRS
ncbi:uncharacterized protein LOC120001468 isoform X2 [Tripterygium wilfordii]|uniref:uncharacterized protein LOC120001468 isoform X2 n=1 Tax=Tripterygium wilfordii TaxID=458696 RepID=UPI0018F7E55D|nr:uncharacterized protein LOC120001468 isoform X2 [Tripterygium wilfordii]